VQEKHDVIDTQAVASELRAALRVSRLTQSAFAAALGTSQPRLSTYLSGQVSPSARFFVHARRIGEVLGQLARLHLLSAPALGVALRDALSDNDDDWAFRLLMQGRDHLRLVLAQHLDLTSGWAAAPLTTRRGEWDTLTATVVGHEFTSAGLEPPAWTQREPLPHAWSYPSALLSPDEVRVATPAWLASLNIFVPERDLVTA
jgi:transcriptional regulator with XRE-family HTH domain